MYNSYEEEKACFNKKKYVYIFNYNSKSGGSIINTSSNAYLNQFRVNLGNDAGGKMIDIYLKDLSFIITNTPNDVNSFDFIPKAIYIKFDNVVDTKSDYISSDAYFFDGILNIEQKFEVKYQNEIEMNYRYKLVSPIKRTINQPIITISFWCYDDRNITTNTISDGKTLSNSLIINYLDIIQNYNGQIPSKMNGINLLAYINNPKNIVIDGLTESYNFMNVINFNGEFKLII